MTNKETLIKLAQDKGFKSQIFTDNEWLYSSKEDLRYYLWMCELDIWLEARDYNLDTNFLTTQLEETLTDYLKGVV